VRVRALFREGCNNAPKIVERGQPDIVDFLLREMAMCQLGVARLESSRFRNVRFHEATDTMDGVPTSQLFRRGGPVAGDRFAGSLVITEVTPTRRRRLNRTSLRELGH